jgi:hypothetical protein
MDAEVARKQRRDMEQQLHFCPPRFMLMRPPSRFGFSNAFSLAPDRRGCNSFWSTPPASGSGLALKFDLMRRLCYLLLF